MEIAFLLLGFGLGFTAGFFVHAIIMKTKPVGVDEPYGEGTGWEVDEK